MCVYIHVCGVFFLMFSKTLFQETKVLSAGFPKEYDHRNLAARHLKLCAYFKTLFICFPYIHPYIHICMHTCTFIDGLIFPKICINTKHIYIYIYICTRPCHPPPSPPPIWDGSHILVPYEIFPLPPCGVVGVWHCPPPPPVVWWMGPIYWSHMRSSPSPPCGVVGVWHCPPPPPVVWWMGSHILVPYEIFPLPPPCGVVGVWHCPPPPPVVWWGCGMVWWVCMVCMVGLVWHVWKVWYVWYVW